MADITTAFVKQFGANVQHLAQQKGSRLRNAVRVETGVTGEEEYFDQLGETAAVRKTTRNSDTPLVKSDHQRVRVAMYDYEWADLIDKEDKLKMLIDPESSYAQSAAWALGRSIDDAIIDSASGTSYRGKAGGTATTLPTAQKVTASSAGLNIVKLLAAKKTLDNADVDPEEPRYIAVTADQIEDLLNITEVKSADYNTIKALAMGQIDTFLGFKFLLCNRLDLDGSSNRLVIAWAQTGLLLALSKEITSRIDQRADKSYSTQVYVSMSIGATRMEEERVIELRVKNKNNF